VSTSQDRAIGLRERNKTKRRDAVLDAALDLLDRPEATPVTTERIAELAEVSVATVYNLVGTREQLLVALIDRLIADLVESARAAEVEIDPVDRLKAMIVSSVEALARRPVAYRRVVLQVTAAASADLHTKLNPASLAVSAFQHAQRMGSVRRDLDAHALAGQLYLSYNGALLRWAAGALSDSGFKTAALHAVATALAASATSGSRARALDELRTLGGEFTL
jgi:AcrR family transcriptional regulator